MLIPKNPYKSYFKRPQDVILASIALIILFPVLLTTALLVLLSLGTPLLFVQNRPGLNGHCFQMYKFRTMKDTYDKFGELERDSLRLTKFGRWLRASSLDELPELVNVIRGDMSLVGPRPLLIEYLEIYNPVQKRRHEARPGLTGLAQVSGRNAISWEERLELDVCYVDSITFLGDWKIIFLTLLKVFRREGISPEGADTMERFTGFN